MDSAYVAFVDVPTVNYCTQMRDAEEMRDKSTQMQGPRVKDEEEMNSSTAANDGAKAMEEGMISIIQAQEEQDQLMELLQSVSNERDSFKESLSWRSSVQTVRQPERRQRS
jgi:hypothetical protein